MNKYKWTILLSTSKFVESKGIYDDPLLACSDMLEEIGEYTGYLPGSKGPTVLSATISIIQ